MALCHSRGSQSFPGVSSVAQTVRVFKRPGSAWIVFDNTDKCRVFRMLALAHRFLQRFL